MRVSGKWIGGSGKRVKKWDKNEFWWNRVNFDGKRKFNDARCPRTASGSARPRGWREMKGHSRYASVGRRGARRARTDRPSRGLPGGKTVVRMQLARKEFFYFWTKSPDIRLKWDFASHRVLYNKVYNIMKQEKHCDICWNPRNTDVMVLHVLYSIPQYLQTL